VPPFVPRACRGGGDAATSALVPMTVCRPAVVVCVVWALLVAARSDAHGAAPSAPAIARPLAVRVQWGGGQPQAWSGRIALVAADTAAPPGSLRWRTLCLESDAAAHVHDEGATILVHQARPVPLDGVEIDVADPRGLRLVVELGPARAGAAVATIDVPLCDLLAETVQRPLDTEGNRLSARLAPGEPLRVVVQHAAADAGPGVARPGDAVRFTVDPLLPVRPDGTSVVELRMRLASPARSGEIAAQSTTLVPASRDAVDGAAHDRWMRFEPVVFDVTLPGEEGVYEVALDAVERGSLRWTRSVGSRTVQVPAVATTAPAEPAAGEWRVIYELDPGSPRLHERLRRLPGVGIGDVPLPAMPLPSFTRPSAALARLPGVSALPNVADLPGVSSLPSMSSISSMVPRLSGLLATGHSRAEAHATGPVLRLPPAASATATTWEGIVVAGAEPGMPHAVEIEFPTGQDATLAVAVLEADAAGTQVLQRHAGGFEVRRSEWSAEPARLETHRLVFWPTTRHPLLVIANPAADAPALFGRVRVLAGPARLPAAGTLPAGRGLHAFLPSPDLAGFGGPERTLRGGGPTVGDWDTHLTAVRHSSDLLRAHAAAGALVTVFARGAALWPSRHTREAARWDAGRVSEAGLDVAGKDVLELLCRVYGREGQRLVPAVSFDAPLPRLETILARGGPDAAGVACVGRDGRPARLDGGGTHYNILDPRVQEVVETIVGELAERLASAPTVDGIALVLPHDGWLHLPGTAWALDDATFGRFIAAVSRDATAGGPPPEITALAAADPADGGRFAARAAAVLGPLRVAWLAWRADEIAAFHARLAARVTVPTAPAAGGVRSLWVVPTTLLADGEAAAGFRPVLGAEEGREPLLELGLDPERSTRDPHIVFVAPQMRGAIGFSARGTVAAANRAAAVAAATARRRGAVLVERSRPLSLAAVVPHGPFGGATATGAWSMHAVIADDTRDGALADALATGDAERVFDTGMALTLPAPLRLPRLEFAALPTRLLEPLAAAPPALVVRTARDGDGTWVQLINPVASAARVELTLDATPAIQGPADGGAALPPQPAARVGYDVGPRSVRAVRLDGRSTVAAASVTYDGPVQEGVGSRIARLRRLRAALESPVPTAVLDNPGFELGGVAGASSGGLVPGWELVEPRRGSVATVPGIAAAGGKALAFSSVHGLSTLRSNPFARPASGRVSVAAWLRIRDGDPQPPLRLALEGVRDDREYYRFAAIGGLTGGRPLAREWSQFVLQVDDLPDTGLDALRVRFDLLGPGTVEIDEVRVFDLAFDERQRVQLSRIVSLLEQGLAEGDVGGCLTGLDGYWPRYLETFVPDTAGRPAAAAPNAPRGRTGVMDRVRRLWQ
jgi:hypothetical protein